MEDPCRCGGIGICRRHPERYVDGRYAPTNLFGAGSAPLTAGPVSPEPQQCSCCTMTA